MCRHCVDNVFILTATYALSVTSTPSLARGEPRGPMEKGMTYMVRPVMQPGYSRSTSAWTQL